MKEKKTRSPDRPAGDQRRLLKAREDAYSALDEIWEKMRGEKPEEVEKLVEEAIREVRKI